MHPLLAKSLRLAKLSAILMPCWVFLLLLYLAIQSALYEEERDWQYEGKETHTLSPKKPREPLQHYVERTGICDEWRNNPDEYDLNETMIGACRNLEALEKAYYKRLDFVPFPHRFIINGSHICDRSTSVIIMVHSLHDYHDRRRAIREAWGGAASRDRWPDISMSHKVRLVFVVGLHKNRTWNSYIRREAEYYGDVIQGDFYEHYHNMTRKSLLGLKWVKNFCSQVKYLIKSDDDMFINIPYLLDTLDKSNMNYSIMGPYNVGAKVLRKGKWALDKQTFPFNYYPPYESGSAYIISGSLVQPLFETSHYVPWIFIDDVYITGILAKIIGARHALAYGFAYWNSKKPSACQFLRNDLLTGTKMTPAFQRDLWATIMKGKNISCDIT